MSTLNAVNRVEFLAKQFNVFTEDECFEISDDISHVYNSSSDELLAVIIKTLKKDSEFEGSVVKTYKKNIKISEKAFTRMVVADPTNKKVYLQWLLNVFIKFLKEEKYVEAIRFFNEDLPMANEYLEIFHKHKKTKIFKELNSIQLELLNIKDPTNINQFSNLEQLFDVVDPFIEKDSSFLEKSLNKFVKLGEAIIPVRDRNFTLYIPKSLRANVALKDFASWCTTRINNGMVSDYRNYLTPNGNKSNLYVIIDNKVYSGESNNLWQIHFETNQIRDRSNRNEANLYDDVLCKSEMLRNFFKNELFDLAKSHERLKGNKSENKYLRYLEEFGNPEGLFEIKESNTLSLTFNNKKIPKIPDLSRFKNLKFMFITHSRLVELDESIINLYKLQMLSIPHNHIIELPSYIGKCKSLIFINLVGNKIKHIPDEISELDPTNGGSLVKMSVSIKDIGQENYDKLIRLLPSVEFESVSDVK